MHALATPGHGLLSHSRRPHIVCTPLLGSMQATLGGSLAVARAPARAVGSAATRATPFMAAARSVAPRSSRQQLRAAATAGGPMRCSAVLRALAALPCSQTVQHCAHAFVAAHRSGWLVLAAPPRLPPLPLAHSCSACLPHSPRGAGSSQPPGAQPRQRSRVVRGG